MYEIANKSNLSNSTMGDIIQYYEESGSAKDICKSSAPARIKNL